MSDTLLISFFISLQIFKVLQQKEIERKVVKFLKNKNDRLIFLKAVQTFTVLFITEKIEKQEISERVV